MGTESAERSGWLLRAGTFKYGKCCYIISLLARRAHYIVRSVWTQGYFCIADPIRQQREQKRQLLARPRSSLLTWCMRQNHSARDKLRNSSLPSDKILLCHLLTFRRSRHRIHFDFLEMVTFFKQHSTQYSKWQSRARKYNVEFCQLCEIFILR